VDVISKGGPREVIIRFEGSNCGRHGRPWIFGAGQASIQLLFANGTRLRAEYWRLTVGGKAGISSFDHQQKYGLPTPIDAVKTLRETLQNKSVTNAFLDFKTGDLLFEFAQDVSLQVLNFTSYETWEISFPDGTGEYSNYVK
jgi:hypothetical protein